VAPSIGSVVPARRVPVRCVLGAALAGLGLLLVVCSQQVQGVGSSLAARASAGTASGTPAPGDGGDAYGWLGSGPIDQVAAALAETGTVPPDERDADLGGVAATGLLLMSVGGAVVAGGAGGLAGGAGGLAGGAGGAAGATSGGSSAIAGNHELAAAAHAAGSHAAGNHAAAGHLATVAGHGSAAGVGNAIGSMAANSVAVGNLTTAAGSGLPLPRPELIVAGLSIFRSMKRITDESDPSGYSAGDIAQLMGDAAGIGALASILAPAGGLVSLAAAGAVAGVDVYSPREVMERLRRSFGQLGYMQGVLDENVSQVDGQLAGLDGLPEGAAASAAPEVPADLAALSDKELRAARSAWAARADVEFDALIRAQEEMNDLDDRRRNLAHQVDAVSDLMGRLDDAGTTPVPPHVGDTLCYGLGWYIAGDPARMSAALRESRSQARASAKPARSATSASSAGQAAATPAPAKTRVMPFVDWAAANKIEGSKLAILQAVAGLERWCGFYDALTGTLQRQLVQMRVQADTASATRRVLSAELQRRTLGAAGK
jgi:hypothetical protein